MCAAVQVSVVRPLGSDHRIRVSVFVFVATVRSPSRPCSQPCLLPGNPSRHDGNATSTCTRALDLVLQSHSMAAMHINLLQVKWSDDDCHVAGSSSRHPQQSTESGRTGKDVLLITGHMSYNGRVSVVPYRTPAAVASASASPAASATATPVARLSFTDVRQ